MGWSARSTRISSLVGIPHCHGQFPSPRSYKPGLNAPGVRFVIAPFPLTDGTGPSRDVKTMIARSFVGAIQTYSRGAHHDRKHCCSTSQQTGRQGCDSPVSGEFSGNGAYGIAGAHQRNQWPERKTVTDATQGVQLATIQALACHWGTEYVLPVRPLRSKIVAMYPG